MSFRTLNGVDLLKATLREIVQVLHSRQITSEELIKIYYDRIERDNIDGHGFRSVIQTIPIESALKIAREKDATRTSSAGNLHGVPMMVKDSIGTKGELELETANGSCALVGHYPKQNATVVDRFLEAGAIVFGKTNQSAFGNVMGANNPSGWSPRGGQCRSCYADGARVKGSSTGSAQALASGFCTATIGTEALGSTIAPASVTALYAMKPTVGKVPNKGIFTITQTFDCVGPMGKSAWDVAASLSVIADDGVDYTAFTAAPFNEIKRYRIGVVREGYEALLAPSLLEEAARAFGDALALLAEAVVKDDVAIPGVNDMWLNTSWDSTGLVKDSVIDHIFKVEAMQSSKDFLDGVADTQLRDMADIVKWQAKYPDLSFFPDDGKQNLLEDVVRLNGRKDEPYFAASAIEPDPLLSPHSFPSGPHLRLRTRAYDQQVTSQDEYDMEEENDISDLFLCYNKKVDN